MGDESVQKPKHNKSFYNSFKTDGGIKVDRPSVEIVNEENEGLMDRIGDR